MNGLHVELASEFKGDTVVLFAMDGTALDAVRSTLERAEREPEQRSALRYSNTTVEFLVKDGPTEINLQSNPVLVQLPRAKLNEIIEKLDALKASAGPCHHYVDIHAPADTLVLSKDEYV